jgi:thymidine phosphorylase
VSSLLPAELIRAKRDGLALSHDQILFLVAGITDGALSDAQVGALAMAIFLQGMNAEETIALTGAMTQSGEVLRWDLDRPVLDKHSTGGVGDKVSLPLAAIIAACGGAVPMISGRGLGHTGGTLDKLESLPGYNVAPSPELFRQTVGSVGCAIIGQTGQLAPADRRLYAVRDATGTVESIPLITASILSKKLAAGLEGLVMDVKTGSGAFMAQREDAQALARSIVDVGAGNGLKISALITDMNQVLGTTAGNAVEVEESLAMLRGDPVDPRLSAVTLALCRELLELGGLNPVGAERAIASGAAYERFEQMVAALGGELRTEAAPVTLEVFAQEDGPVSAIDVRALGLAIITLGGGRLRESDAVDHAVGLTQIAGLGDEVGRPGGRPVAVIHARESAAAERAAAEVRGAFSVGDTWASDAPPAAEPVLQRVV